MAAPLAHHSQDRPRWPDHRAARHASRSTRKEVTIGAKVRDVVGLYVDPPDRALVLGVDEKTQIQALDRTQHIMPLQPGRIARRTHDDIKHGTTSLFAALDHRSGKVIGKCYARHRAKEFRSFLEIIDEQTDSAL